MNHTTTAADVDEIVDWIASVEIPVPSEAAAASAHEREPGVRQGWLEQRSADAIGSLALFADLSDDQRSRLRAATWEVEIPAGTDVVHEWEFAREFYVILDGSVSVTHDDREVDVARAPATSSARWPRSTGGRGSATRGRPRSPRRRTSACWSCRRRC